MITIGVWLLQLVLLAALVVYVRRARRACQEATRILDEARQTLAEVNEFACELTTQREASVSRHSNGHRRPSV